MTIILRGLAWDHPRATRPLAAAHHAITERWPDVHIVWEAQPLDGFESRSIAEMTAKYDLLLFDHPHIGAIADASLMVPLNDLADVQGITDIDYVGPSLASYRNRGQLWGLPLDAACQVACWRPDLMASLEAAPPQRWTDVLRLGRRARGRGLALAHALNPVHALMTFFSLCADRGAPLGGRLDTALDADIAADALADIAALAALCPVDALGWDSIAAQEAMAARDDLPYCPAVYGFSHYAQINRPRRLAYGSMPGAAGPGTGSTIGGVGIGVSAGCPAPELALAIAAFLAGREAQVGIVAAEGGQPAHRTAWCSAAVNQPVGGFYHDTLATIDSAWMRPRFAGYVAFQHLAGDTVSDYLHGAIGAADTIARIEHLWATAVKFSKRT